MSEKEDGERTGGFKVVDRRRFDAAGDEREASESQVSSFPAAASPAAQPALARAEPAAAAASPAAQPALARPAASAQHAGFGVSADPTLQTPGVPIGQPFAAPDGADVATLGELVLSLYTQALLLLGEVAGPEGNPPEVDLGSARYTIDLLGVLQTKTRGNLDTGEQELLEKVLYDLRLRFVSHRTGG